MATEIALRPGLRRQRKVLMRVERPGNAGMVSGTKAVQRNSGEGFTLAEGEQAPAPSPNSGVKSIGGIDILMALQGIEEPGERRRRAVARGRGALDALDELKIGFLTGGLDGATVFKLKAAISGLKDGSGDPMLDGVLAEIELRLEVELAKMTPLATA
jgi:class II flagellar assembly regulator FliX